MNIKEAALRRAVLAAISDALKAESERDKQLVFEAMTGLYDQTGSKVLDVKLPDGTRVASLTLALTGDKTTVTDRAALLEWARENAPEFVHTVPAHDEVSESGLMETLTFTDEGDAVTASGELVPGIRKVAGGQPSHTMLKFQPNGRQAIADAWASGMFGNSLPGMAPALTDGAS